MKLTAVGIDLAKQVFQIHGIDQHGKVLVRRQLRRDQMATDVLRQPSSLLGRDGGLRRRSPLGAQAAGNGAHRASDSSAVRQALRQDQ